MRSRRSRHSMVQKNSLPPNNPLVPPARLLARVGARARGTAGTSADDRKNEMNHWNQRGIRIGCLVGLSSEPNSASEATACGVRAQRDVLVGGSSTYDASRCRYTVPS